MGYGLVTKEIIAECITESLFQEELLNEADATDIEKLEKCVQGIILEHLKNYIIVSGTIIE